MTNDGLTRRHALTGAALVTVGGPVLTACAGESADPGGGGSAAEAGPTINCQCHGSKFSATDGSVVSGPAPSPLPAEEVTVNGSDIEVGGTVIATTSDIPEGGGTVFGDDEVVVTQPEAGEFKAFSAICTHQSCTVVDVTP